MGELESRSELEKQIEEDGVEIVLGLAKPSLMDQLPQEDYLVMPFVEILKESLASYISEKIALPTQKFLLLVRRGELLAAMRLRVKQFTERTSPSLRALSASARAIVKKARRQAVAQLEKLERANPANSCAKVIRSALALSDRMQQAAQGEGPQGIDVAGARRPNASPEVRAKQRLVLFATLQRLACDLETPDLSRLGFAMSAAPARRDDLLRNIVSELGTTRRRQRNAARNEADFDLLRGIKSFYLEATRKVDPKPSRLSDGGRGPSESTKVGTDAKVREKPPELVVEPPL